VFDDRQALDRQTAQDEAAEVLCLVQAGALTHDMEWTVWEATSSS